MNIEDHTALRRYLLEKGHIVASERTRFATLKGGVSNRTVLVSREDGEDWVLKQALAKLRVKVDWFSAPERIQREAAGLRALGEIIPGYVPEFVFADDGNHILAMTAVPQPHVNWKTLLLRGETSYEYARTFGRLLALMHNAATHQPELMTIFAERRFFEELRLEPYYAYTATQVPQARAFLETLMAHTRQRKLALVHGDYSPKNVLICDDDLIILDFEVIHFGDPAFDIGFSMTHLLSKAHLLPEHRKAFLAMASEYWQEYAANRREETMAELQGAAVRHTLACLLARVAGRSPLEYLDEAQRQRQQRMVLELLPCDINNIPDLISAFRMKLDRLDEHNQRIKGD